MPPGASRSLPSFFSWQIFTSWSCPNPSYHVSVRPQRHQWCCETLWLWLGAIGICASSTAADGLVSERCGSLSGCRDENGAEVPVTSASIFQFSSHVNLGPALHC